MLSKNVHIISLDMPCTADCSNAIDKFNLIKALHRQGCGIHLHFFDKNQCGIPNELNQFCQTITVYPCSIDAAKNGCHSLTQQLFSNISTDNFSLLVTDSNLLKFLPTANLETRKIAVRLYEEEKCLNKPAENRLIQFFKKIRSSPIPTLHDSNFLSKNYIYLCETKNIVNFLRTKIGAIQSFALSNFLNWQQVNADEGIGSFCLYHGNLSLPENEKAAIWLLNNVFNKIRKPLIIAGKDPGSRLQKIATLCSNCCLVANPSETEMNDLIRKAHIHVLPSYKKEKSGVSLKLLHALYQGRHCIVNDDMINSTGLEPACHIASNAEAFASVIMQLYHQPFTQEEITLRKHLLNGIYDNNKNAELLMTWL